MSYKEKPQIKLYAYSDSSFVLQAIIDDYQSCSWERNLYQAGQFTIQINYNLPNAHLFERGLFVQFGSDEYDFGEIYSVTDSIGSDGKASQTRTIIGYDARYLLKRRVIKNLNADENWTMTAKGEICLRNLILDQCGENAESKRQLPIVNEIPESSEALGSSYTVSEAYTNLYEVCVTIATQSGFGWRIKFDGDLTLECYSGTDISTTVFFSSDFESIANGQFVDSTDNYVNAVYVGGKGDGTDRDIYEGEDSDDVDRIIVGGEESFLVDEEGNYIVADFSSPTGIERFECWDDQSELSTTDEYRTEANSILTQYMQDITVSGAGLSKCPYIYKEEYDVGDTIKVSFSGKSANVQIQSVTENWSKGSYGISFAFGKPEITLSSQLQVILRKIQKSSSTSSTISSVMWYTVPSETEQALSEVTYDTLGFTGEGGSFELYLDDEGTGAKNYNIYGKNLTGDITLTTAYGGSLTLASGDFITRIYVDAEGDIIQYT